MLFRRVVYQRQFYYVSQAASYLVHEPRICVGWKFMGGDMSRDLISRNWAQRCELVTVWLCCICVNYLWKTQIFPRLCPETSSQETKVAMSLQVVRLGGLVYSLLPLYRDNKIKLEQRRRTINSGITLMRLKTSTYLSLKSWLSSKNCINTSGGERPNRLS